MIVYTVHEPPNPPADRIDRAERFEFVRDGFQPFAAALPPLWMVMNGLWLVLLAYLLVTVGATLGLRTIGVPPQMIALVTVAANIIVGFEADRLKRWSLNNRGWAELGTVSGRNRAECERRFFDTWLVGQPMLRSAAAAAEEARTGFAPRPQALLPAQAAARNGEGRAAVMATDAGQRPLWRRLFGR